MKVWQIVAIFLGVIILGPLACSALGVWGSATTAPGRVVEKTLRTDNIIFNYERFIDINQNYNARLAQIKEQKTFIETDASADEKARLRTELSAMRMSCRELASEYNADSQKMNRSLFKDQNLPETLDMEACDV